MIKILAVAGDAGGAQALLPVLNKLKEQKHVILECFAYAAAERIILKENFCIVEGNKIDVKKYNLLFLGTSCQPEEWEIRLIRSAKINNVRTLSVLDSWVSYRERFTAKDGEFVLPDTIAIMDETAKQEMILLGFPEECLKITGQPVFDKLSELQHSGWTKRKIDEIRDQLSINNDMKVVLYVSQPFSQLGADKKLGFHENEVFEDILGSLNSLAVQKKDKFVVFFLLHPREYESFTLPVSLEKNNFDFRILKGLSFPATDILSVCDYVIGVNSLFLMEACYLRKHVISYQPNLKIKDPLPSNRFGWSRAIYLKDRLHQSVYEEFYDPKTIAKRDEMLNTIQPVNGATDNVLSCILG